MDFCLFPSAGPRSATEEVKRSFITVTWFLTDQICWTLPMLPNWPAMWVYMSVCVLHERPRVLFLYGAVERKFPLNKKKFPEEPDSVQRGVGCMESGQEKGGKHKNILNEQMRFQFVIVKRTQTLMGWWSEQAEESHTAKEGEEDAQMYVKMTLRGL